MLYVSAESPLRVEVVADPARAKSTAAAALYDKARVAGIEPAQAYRDNIVTAFPKSPLGRTKSVLLTRSHDDLSKLLSNDREAEEKLESVIGAEPGRTLDSQHLSAIAESVHLLSDEGARLASYRAVRLSPHSDAASLIALAKQNSTLPTDLQRHERAAVFHRIAALPAAQAKARAVHELAPHILSELAGGNVSETGAHQAAQHLIDVVADLGNRDISERTEDNVPKRYTETASMRANRNVLNSEINDREYNVAVIERKAELNPNHSLRGIPKLRVEINEKKTMVAQLDHHIAFRKELPHELAALRADPTVVKRVGLQNLSLSEPTYHDEAPHKLSHAYFAAAAVALHPLVVGLDDRSIAAGERPHLETQLVGAVVNSRATQVLFNERPDKNIAPLSSTTIDELAAASAGDGAVHQHHARAVIERPPLELTNRRAVTKQLRNAVASMLSSADRRSLTAWTISMAKQRTNSGFV